MLNFTPLKPGISSANNANKSALNFGANIQQSKTTIFQAKPKKDEFIQSEPKEEKKPSLAEKIKKVFSFPQKKEPVAVKK